MIGSIHIAKTVEESYHINQKLNPRNFAQINADKNGGRAILIKSINDLYIISFAIIAVSSLRAMVTGTENIAIMNVTYNQDLVVRSVIMLYDQGAI